MSLLQGIQAFFTSNWFSQPSKTQTFRGVLSVASGTPYVLALSSFTNANSVSDVQGMYVDNTGSTTPLSIMTLAGQTLYCPPLSAMMTPIMIAADLNVTFTGNNPNVPFIFTNFPVPFGIFPTQSEFNAPGYAFGNGDVLKPIRYGDAIYNFFGGINSKNYIVGSETQAVFITGASIGLHSAAMSTPGAVNVQIVGSTGIFVSKSVSLTTTAADFPNLIEFQGANFQDILPFVFAEINVAILAGAGYSGRMDGTLWCGLTNLPD